MAYPVWLTPAGNLGTVPEAEYYQFTLDAYDTSGGILKFFKLSGTLPPGLQITQTGSLQGIPISTGGPDLNQTYTFTVRVQNQTTLLISDRSFNLTVTNIAPPIIVPRNVDLGEYFDGQPINIQLEATEFIAGGNLVWSLKSGTLPPGLTVSSSGLIGGYINLIPAVGPAGDPGWDDNQWDTSFIYANASANLGWDFPLGTAAKHFEFTVEVTDGGLSSTSTYKMYVVPKKGTTADSTLITVDTTIINGVKFTVDTGGKHNPIIISTQDNVPLSRQGSWFSLQIQAIDLDEDILEYTVPNLSAGTVDEQVVVGNGVPYIGRSFVIDGNISVGIANISSTIPDLISGDVVQVLNPFYDFASGQTSYVWYDATINNHGKIRITGNTIITANVGDYISQSIGNANAKITSTTSTTGNILLEGTTILADILIGGNLIVSANVGDIITQIGSTGNATVTSNVRLGALVSATYNSGVFSTTAGNLRINGINANAYPVSVSTSLIYPYFRANIGDTITQTSTGANATVTKNHSTLNADTMRPSLFEVQFNSGTFAVGATGGNVKINGNDVVAWPAEVFTNADIGYIYNTSNTFRLNASSAAGLVYIDGRNSFAIPTNFLEVGVDVGASPSTQGTIGFDENKFDQTTLILPGSLSINTASGWITGFLPAQTANETTYNFEVIAFKRDYPSYQTSQLFDIIVLGDLYNTVEWLTPSFLGTIENGEVSDLGVVAFSPEGRNLYYYYTPGSYINMVQGLRLQPDGLISGRVSFELFGLDSGETTFDADIITRNPTTTFDHTFEFTVTARTYDQTASSNKKFTILVRERNVRPYDNVYLKAQLNNYQRLEFRDIIQNTKVFPPELIYRATDPWFGLARDVRTLFLPGLNASNLAVWSEAIRTNHFSKRLLFTEVKTAVAKKDGVYDVIENITGDAIGTFNAYTRIFVPFDLNSGYSVLSNSIPTGTTIGDQSIKYEVVYAELKDQNSNAEGQGPANSIDLQKEITNPYYDSNGNAYVIAAPNAFTNMDDIVVKHIGYQDQGVLPDWMTSIQPNGQQLGFVRAVVLAYTVPGAAETVAWRFKELNFDLNEINFVADRYYLDNIYSSNYDLTANAYITSRETSFDRYPPLGTSFSPISSVDYAVTQSFQDINEKAVSEIVLSGGLDGITSFRNGETLVFYEQEFNYGIAISDSYNQGWAISTAPWDDSDPAIGDWDFNSLQGWDPASYVPGYREWISSKQVFGSNVVYSTPNQRMGIWRINVNNDFVRLTLANVSVNVVSAAANTTGYGSNVSVSSTNNLFVGMPIRGVGLGSDSSITDIIGGNIVVYPAVSGTITNPWTAVPTASLNDVVFVRNGFTNGGVNIYYDPVIKTNKTVPSWNRLPQQVKAKGTTFDGDGTKFYDYRDNYVIPQQGEKLVRFPRTNVFV